MRRRLLSVVRSGARTGRSSTLSAPLLQGLGDAIAPSATPTPAKALYDLSAEQWLLPPMSDAAQEVPLAS